MGLICDEDRELPLTSSLQHDPSQTCANVVTVTGKSMCPAYTINALVDFVDEYYYIFGTVAILGGVFFLFLGRKLFMVALALIGVVATVFIVLIIFYSTFLRTDTATWVGWTVLAVSVLLGGLVGFLFTKIARFGAAILSGWGGFMLGVLINEMWLYIYGSEWLFWGVNIGTAGLCAVVAFVLFNQAIIISTAFLGAYFIARGIAIFAGGFPPAFELISQVESGAIDHVSYAFYGYLVGIAVLTIVGSIAQFRIFKSMPDTEKSAYERIN